jgi:hypothetical protein
MGDMLIIGIENIGIAKECQERHRGLSEWAKE